MSAPHSSHHPKGIGRAAPWGSQGQHLLLCRGSFLHAPCGSHRSSPLSCLHLRGLEKEKLEKDKLEEKKRRRNPWGTRRGRETFLEENKPAKQTPERLERERERFPFGACTVLIQHSRLSVKNKHFRPQLPLCSSPCLTGDVTDAFGQQCCSTGWGGGEAGLLCSATARAVQLL